MTQSDEALVTQADREAAAAICSALLGAYATNSLNPQILAGKHDNHMHVQIVAHHRIAARREGIEEAAKVADEIAAKWNGDNREYAVRHVANQLRALAEKQP